MDGPALDVPATGAAAPVRLLHLEDDEDDHLLVRLQLQRDGVRGEFRRVDTREAFVAALAEPWDAVLSDYHLPGFTGVQALALLRQAVDAGRAPLPFVLISGQIGEDMAVEAMRLGASDYLLKNRLARLAPALRNAIAAVAGERARRDADLALQDSRARLSALAQHLQTSVEAERQAIAREIHDDVGGTLTALKFELDGIRRHAGSAEIERRAVGALETVSGALEACQRLMQNLRPAILEQGLVAALQWLTGRFAARTGIACEFRCRAGSEETLPALPPGVPLVAYRTVQEALTNVHKHAGARRVVVDLSLSAGVLSLEISDDGRGLSSTDLAKATSFGVRGLHERAATVGGWVDLSSGAHGTSLILSVPLDGESSAGAADGLADAGAQDGASGAAEPFAVLVSPPAASAAGAHPTPDTAPIR